MNIHSVILATGLLYTFEPVFSVRKVILATGLLYTFLSTEDNVSLIISMNLHSVVLATGLSPHLATITRSYEN